MAAAVTVDGLKSELASLRDVHKGLERELKATQEDYTLISKERDRLRSRVAELEKELGDVKEELEVTQEDYRELHSNLQAEEEETARLENEAKQVQAELQMEHNRRMDVEAELAKTQEEVNRLTKLCNKWERDNMMKMMESDESGQNPLSESEMVQQLKDMLETKSALIDDAELKVKQLEDKNSKLADQLKKVQENPYRFISSSPSKEEIAGGNDNNNNNNNNNNGTNDSVRQAMQGQISKLTEQMATLREEKSKMESDLDEAHEFGEEVHKRLQRAVEMLKQSREENAKLKAQLDGK